MVFPYTTSPDDTVWASVTMPRWMSEWKQNHKSINFSGLCQEILIQLMKEQDPEYFNTYEKYMPKEIRRKETTLLPKMKISSVNVY